MLLDYEVIDEGWFCRRQDKPKRKYICYRSVICHILFNALKAKDDSSSKEILNRITDAVKHTINLSCDYIEIYHVKNGDNKTPLILVDQTKGTFPLIFHSYKKSRGSGTRITALQESLSDLNNKQDELFILMNNYDNWNIELQDELQKVFTYQKDKNDQPIGCREMK